MSERNQELCFADVDEILRIIDQFPAAEIVYARGDLKLHVRRAGVLPAAQPGAAVQVGAAAPGPAPLIANPASAPLQSAAAPRVAEVRQGLLAVESPMMGVFYATPSPDAEPFVQPGQVIKKGVDLCIIEVMKVMNMVKSPVAGVVEEIVARNAEMVERGQALVWIRPAKEQTR